MAILWQEAADGSVVTIFLRSEMMMRFIQCSRDDEGWTLKLVKDCLASQLVARVVYWIRAELNASQIPWAVRPYRDS